MLRFLIELWLFRFAVHGGSLFYLRFSLNLVNFASSLAASLSLPYAYSLMRHFGGPAEAAQRLAAKSPNPTTDGH
jgi:hypothetical protein